MAVVIRWALRRTGVKARQMVTRPGRVMPSTLVLLVLALRGLAAMVARVDQAGLVAWANTSQALAASPGPMP